MADTTLPEPPVLTKTVFDAVTEKAKLSIGPMLVLGILAGIYIGLGGLFATISLSQGDALPFGVGQVLAGLVFALGLALVLVAGAELFTGNTLMAGPVALGQLGASRALLALCIVYTANFVGSLTLAGLVALSDIHANGEGAVGRAALDLAVTKLDKSFGVTLTSGILANMLVCLAVWMAYGGQTVTAKLAALLLPIAAFVAAGLEHSVANMYLLPYAFFIQGDHAGYDVTFIGIFANLLAATMGNLIGGALVALAYVAAYRNELAQPDHRK